MRSAQSRGQPAISCPRTSQNPPDSQISLPVIHGRSASGGSTMLTGMTDEDWATVLQVFTASCSRRGAKGRNDRRFLEALHYFTVHNITWRALPERFGNWNSVWKRF